jgi:hypothetical protein
VQDPLSAYDAAKVADQAGIRHNSKSSTERARVYTECSVSGG